MAFSKSFNELFILPDNKSDEWDSKLFEYGYAHDEEKLNKHLESANEIYLEEKQIYTAINSFTLDTDSEEESMRLIEGLKEADFIKEVDVTKSTLLIKTVDGDIRVCKLTEMIPGLKEDDPNLLTEDRKGNCHEKSIQIANSMGKIKNDIVTGFVFGYSDQAKYLHSWVEFNYQGEDMVIDYTLNALMNKEGYYMIQRAKPLSRIDSKLLKEDRKVLDKFDKLGYFNIKEYLLFRDEIMKDFDKNKKVIGDERE